MAAQREESSLVVHIRLPPRPLSVSSSSSSSSSSSVGARTVAQLRSVSMGKLLSHRDGLLRPLLIQRALDCIVARQDETMVAAVESQPQHTLTSFEDTAAMMTLMMAHGVALHHENADEEDEDVHAILRQDSVDDSEAQAELHHIFPMDDSGFEDDHHHHLTTADEDEDSSSSCPSFFPNAGCIFEDVMFGQQAHGAEQHQPPSPMRLASPKRKRCSSEGEQEMDALETGDALHRHHHHHHHHRHRLDLDGEVDAMSHDADKENATAAATAATVMCRHRDSDRSPTKMQRTKTISARYDQHPTLANMEPCLA